MGEKLKYFPGYAIIANLAIVSFCVYILLDVTMQYSIITGLVILAITEIIYFLIPVSYITHDEFVSTPYYMFKFIRKPRFKKEFDRDIRIRKKDFWMETHATFIHTVVTPHIRIDDLFMNEKCESIQDVLDHLSIGEKTSFNSINSKIDCITVEYVGNHPNNMYLFRFNPLLWIFKSKSSLRAIRHYKVLIHLKSET